MTQAIRPQSNNLRVQDNRFLDRGGNRRFPRWLQEKLTIFISLIPCVRLPFILSFLRLEAERIKICWNGGKREVIPISMRRRSGWNLAIYLSGHVTVATSIPAVILLDERWFASGCGYFIGRTSFISAYARRLLSTIGHARKSSPDHVGPVDANTAKAIKN